MAKMEHATFAGGCFWCTEAIFRRLKGVIKVLPGYARFRTVLARRAGGEMENPSYEAVRISFDPKVISYRDLLDVFWATHDPTSMDKQGADEGTQYRFVIFYENEVQEKTAEESKSRLEKSGKHNNEIVTQIKPLGKFYDAEGYHKEYYEKNRTAPYCMVVIDPKIKKLYKEFGDKVKDRVT